MQQIKEELNAYISKKGNRHILIHSDVLFGFKIKFGNDKKFLAQHIQELQETLAPLAIFMPTFNYDFCEGKAFDIKNDPSQVGILTEYFRSHEASWRSGTPVFNFAGTGENPQPKIPREADPFDENSIFGYLHQNKALMMHYGSKIDYSTLIHYAERISGELIYRYDKIFNGHVIDVDGKKHDSRLIYHVRPKEYTLEYDWPKLENDLFEAAILSKFKEGRTRIILGRFDEIVEFWVEKLKEDPFYLLEEKSIREFKPIYKKLGRPFLLTDFE